MGINPLRPSLLIWLLTTAFALAQTPTPSPTPTPPNNSGRPYWTASLPGGTFMVALDTISSISKSEYIVDNSARVTEVSIGTIGSVQGRFYYLEPYTPQSPLASGQDKIELLKGKVNETLGRVSEDDPNNMVLKNFPTTTHAHTVEFHISSMEKLNKLYGSLETAIKNHRDTRFKTE